MARGEHVTVLVPHLPHGLSDTETNAQLRSLIDNHLARRVRGAYISWYYTPMALKFTRHLSPAAIVYDCMDELSQFKAAPPELVKLEDELFGLADLVFTGGLSLYEYKQAKHPNIHPFPSSVDIAHFQQARARQPDPHDQAAIPRPRVGFAGVIDERFDADLVGGIARARPDWQLVLIGPIVKIDPDTLPRAPNIHYPGPKPYDQLPAYLSGWDLALLPFARNTATRFISPTKTPEYLAAGLPVVSTSIRDVVRTYGESGFVKIADSAEGMIEAGRSLMEARRSDSTWLARVDAMLSENSWERTFEAMWRLVEAAVEERRAPRPGRTRQAYALSASAAAAGPHLDRPAARSG
jgi:UDP-galactopyranose mutase